MDTIAASPRTRRSALDLLGVLALLALATAGGLLLPNHVSIAGQAMLYVLAVVIASYFLPWAPSVVCAFGAVIGFNFFFVHPKGTLEVDSQENLIALVVMLAVALLISKLATALRRRTSEAVLNEGRARQLQELATELAGLQQVDDVLAAGQRALDAAFPGPCTISTLDTLARTGLPDETRAEFLRLPDNCVIELGTRVQI